MAIAMHEHAAYRTQMYVLSDTSYNIHSYTNTHSLSPTVSCHIDL